MNRAHHHDPSSTAPPAIRPRKPDLHFGPDIPRHWNGDSPLATHLVNAVNLLFPDGERFFVRSVKRYLEDIDDPELRARIRGFFGQEGRHANAHETFFVAMREQGYEIDGFLATYKRLAYAVIEKRISPELRLAATAAAEHFTAIMADGALRHDLLAAAHPTMRHLLEWHAAEEIEHKAVAFDVLQHVDPSYRLRMKGLALATAVLTTAWAYATVVLVRQERVPRRALLRDLLRQRGRAGALRHVFVRGIRDYARRDFHPDDADNYDLARAYLESSGLEEAA